MFFSIVFNFPVFSVFEFFDICLGMYMALKGLLASTFDYYVIKFSNSGSRKHERERVSCSVMSDCL